MYTIAPAVSNRLLGQGASSSLGVPSAVTSDYIKAIAILSDLETLQIMAPLKDDDLAYLESLQRLKTLDLWWTPIDDAGVERLSKMDKLKWLRLSHTKITDKSLNISPDSTNLETLYVQGTSVTSAAVEKFRQQRPTCKVIVED